MTKTVLLNGFIGRGINGLSEIRITTDDDINLSEKIICFTGEIKNMDSYFNNHPLSGVHNFIVKTDNIIAIVEKVT
jgi:hypothetical protein